MLGLSLYDWAWESSTNPRNSDRDQLSADKACLSVSLAVYRMPFLSMNLKSRKKTPANGQQLVSESRVRVRYAETDQMGVAYYANYLIWFEVGRSQFCNDCGFSYRDMERETGLFLIVAEASCRYRTPARYEDELLVQTTLDDITRRTVSFGYQIERVDGASIAAGQTTHVLINKEGRISSFPQKYLSFLRGDQKAEG